MGHSDAEFMVVHTVAKLRAERTKLGLSKRALAIKAGLDPKTIGLIERGERNPTLYTLALIATALEMDLGYIISSVKPEAL